MMELTTSDMILCCNLLTEDAAEWDRIEEAGSEKGPAKRRAEDRRALAAKFREEVERRDAVTTAAFNRESA